MTILELLQSRENISGAELARRLEVEDRSVRRYITMLQDLGIPIEATRGRHGTYQLRPGFKLPPLMFNEEEALAVILGLLLIQTKGLTLATPSVEGALAKVSRVLPTQLRQRLKILEQVVELVPHHVYDGIMTSGAYILQISEAINRQQQVWLEYSSEKGEQTVRTVEAYGLAYWAGRWYTVGYCRLRQEIRAFRLDRIIRLEIRPEQFKAPANFDCTEYLLSNFGTTVPMWESEVIFKGRLSDGQQRILQAHGSIETTTEGIIYRSQIGDLAETARFLIDFRCQFRVIKPLELKTALLQLAEEIKKLAD